MNFIPVKFHPDPENQLHPDPENRENHLQLKPETENEKMKNQFLKFEIKKMMNL